MVEENDNSDENSGGGSGDTTNIMKVSSDTLTIERERAKDQEACFIVIRGNPQGKRFEVIKDTMYIGRDFTADIVLNDPNVSRKHAMISKAAEGIKLRDNKSTNGTFVNNKQITGEVDLKKEDMIKVGNTILKYLPKGHLEIYYIGTLESAAHTDSLTKVYNKGHIMDALDAEFKRAKALHQDLSILIFDLDFFKKINDTHGHDAGDFVLKESIAVLKSKVFTKNSIVGRFGGEEFLVLIPDSALESAFALGESIRETLEKHVFDFEGKKISVTASVGVAEMALDVDSSSALFKLADKAVYAAKAGGRNRVCK